MSGVTGIELGPNYCVLVRGGRLGSHRTVSAASTIAPSAWTDDPVVLVDRLRQARQRNDLSSRARVVAWSPRGTGAATSHDAALAPLTEAGFEIVSVLSPAQALARVVHARQVGAPAGTAVAALSLNSHGAAIAIVAGTEVIHSRAVEWSLGTPFANARGTRSELLDRYLIVSQIAPQLQHGIDLVRPVHGVTVTSVVACGNLPDLRSLAMLLIEEMDIEVETLDSAELLDPSVAPGALADTVASLQLAAAVASTGENRMPVHVETEPAPAAGHTSDSHAPGRARPALSPSNGPGSSPSKRPGARLQSLAALAALAFCTGWSFMQLSLASPARPIFPGGIAPAAVAIAPPVPVPPGLRDPQEPQELTVQGTTGRAAQGRPRGPSSGDSVQTEASLIGLPLPSVDGIMIAGPHRFAIVGGNVVVAGDPVGPRAVSRIERDGVVLREPSGREIYVAIRAAKTPDPRFVRD